MAKQMISNNNLSGSTPSGLTRERSFVRTLQPNKRRSFADDQQLRPKPAIEIYRPPSNSVLKLMKFVIRFSIRFQLPTNRYPLRWNDFKQA